MTNPGRGHAPSVAVIIPVLDEEAAIGQVIAALPVEVVSEVVVVDGGSHDQTRDVAEGAGAQVVVETQRGYGRACARGVDASSAEILVFLDGDGSDDASQVERLVAPLRANQADLILGARTYVEGAALPWYARAGNVLAAAIISLAWRQRITDLPSFKAIRRRDLVALGMTEATYGWTVELIAKSARRGLRLREIPLPYYPRAGGVSKVSGNPRASLKAAAAILRVLARHAFGRGETRYNSPLLGGEEHAPSS